MKTAFALLALLSLAVALPSALKRQSDVDCGGDEYTQDEITAAANAACEYLEEGTTAGGSKSVITVSTLCCPCSPTQVPGVLQGLRRL